MAVQNKIFKYTVILCIIIFIKRLKYSITLTPCAPIGGNTPALGTGPARELLAGGGPRPPLLELQV